MTLQMFLWALAVNTVAWACYQLATTHQWLIVALVLLSNSLGYFEGRLQEYGRLKTQN